MFWFFDMCLWRHGWRYMCGGRLPICCLTNVKSGRWHGVAVLDELDRRIIEALQADARASYRAIAEKSGTTPPTAIARIQRMKDLGVIEGFVVRIAPWAGMSSPPQQAQSAAECHQCHGPLPEPPLEAKVGGRHHWFCCGHCQATFQARHDKLSASPNGLAGRLEAPANDAE